MLHSDSHKQGHARTEEQDRADICQIGRWMCDRDFIVACEGNLSVRLHAGRILPPPTCISKAMLSPEDLVVTDADGKHLSGSRIASSEIGMHLLFYRLRPDVNAICQPHRVTATRF